MRQISALAHEQLEAWRKYARVWIVAPEVRHEGQNGYRINPGKPEIHLVCLGLYHPSGNYLTVTGCGQSIFQINDGENWRNFDIETLESLIVAHIRNVHREIEDAVYSG